MTLPRDSRHDTLNDFLETSAISPPSSVFQALRPQVLADLKPSWRRILAKTLAIHLLVATASMIVCPQFGLGPFGGDAGLLHWVRDWSPLACAAICGASFMLGTGWVTAIFLSPEEKRTFHQRGLLIWTSLSALSWSIFMLFTSNHPPQRIHHLHAHRSWIDWSSLLSGFESLSWNATWLITASLSAALAFRVASLYPPRRGALPARET
ncbi:MAG: hypothetical protein RJB38_1498 [Pseudomonadota bacterium]|jgi:hypothetical protein